jgi:DNA-binding NarL/FixJ family response regulator
MRDEPTNSNGALRVLIADDAAMIREQVKRMLSKVDGLEICGIAADGLEAIQMFRELGPDLVILDISMPYKSGVAVLEEIREHGESPVVVIYTADPEPILQKVCLKSGANHFIDKSDFNRLTELAEELASKRRTESVGV